MAFGKYYSLPRREFQSDFFILTPPYMMDEFQRVSSRFPLLFLYVLLMLLLALNIVFLLMLFQCIEEFASLPGLVSICNC